jgi:formylglycine-generating enzyme required for sulfatase activity
MFLRLNAGYLALPDEGSMTGAPYFFDWIHRIYRNFIAMPTAPLKTFIIYAREDRPSLDTLMGHLAVFERNGAVRFWYDREITGGKDWDDEIRFNLKTADIVVLLISPEFFLSDYIHSVELTEAFQRDRAGEALVVPVILKKCLWHKHAEIARLQALPSEAKPVFDKNHWPDPHDGFYDIAECFDRILDDSATETRRLRKHDRIKQEEEVEKKKQEETAALQKREVEVAAQKRQAEAAALQKREAEAAEKKRLEAEAAREKALPDMVFVQGGTFQMGSPDKDKEAYSDEKPQHEVTVRDFEIGKYPVTQKLWQEILGANPSHFKGCDDCPVENVSWGDVQEFLKKLNTRYPGQNYRLPTEAEWEYAARGGRLSKGFTYAGSNDLKEVGWFYKNSDNTTHPVGGKKANELGLHDMSGNVWELCADWYGDYPSGDQTNPTGPTEGLGRVGRGGSWSDARCCCVGRNLLTPAGRYGHLGFRLASSPQ